MKLLIHIDGGSRGNPGPAASGVLIQDADSHETLYAGGHFLGRATNNEAEYRGLLKALELAAAWEPDEIRVHSDSELLVRQVTGVYRVKSPKLRPLLEEAQARLLALGPWQIQHVRREANREADRLANLSLDQKRDVVESGGGDSPAPCGNASSDPASPSPPPAPSPRFDVQLGESPGRRCPAATTPEHPFHFGPHVPAGFCLHAAEAVLGAAPHHWAANQEEARTRCAHCGVPLLITRADP